MPTPVPVREGRLRVCMMVTYDMASPGGGVKQHALHLAASLRRLGDEVMLVGPSSVPTDDPDVRSFGGIVNIPANGSDNNLGLLVSPRAIAKFFREHHFDVIHIHEPLQPALSYWTVWLTRHVPHVATFHAFMEEEGFMLRWARKAWGATMFPWIQRAIAVSQPAARYASGAWNRELSIILAGSVIGRLTMGWLADRWHKKHVMFLIYSIVAVSIPMLVYAPTPATLKICAFIFGIGLGGDYMIIPLMAAELYGVAILGRVMGIVLTADSVSESLVPMLVASMRDAAGSYRSGFLVLVVLAGIGAAAVALLPRSAEQRTS